MTEVLRGAEICPDWAPALYVLTLLLYQRPLLVSAASADQCIVILFSRAILAKYFPPLYCYLNQWLPRRIGMYDFIIVG
jgi:hypothetical protein